MSLDATIEEISINSSSGTVAGGESVDNNGGVIDDTWIFLFDSGTSGKIIGANAGYIDDFSDLTSEIAPTNSGNEYFNLPANFFTGTWVSGDSYSFRTTAKLDERTYISNHYYYQVASGNVDLSSDTIKAVLCNDSLTFDIDSHATYSDISTYELSTGNGYTNGGITLTRNGSLTEDDTNDQAYQEYNTIQIDASGGTIGPFKHIVFFDDDTADNTIIGCITYRDTWSITNGNSFYLFEPITNILGS